MSQADGRRFENKFRRRSFGGRAVSGTYSLGIAARGDEEIAGNRGDYVQILPVDGADTFSPGYCGYLFEGPDLPAQARHYVVSQSIPCLTDSSAVGGISSGDIVEIDAAIGKARIVQFGDSQDCALLVTNRCNNNCLMCPDSERSHRDGRDASLDWIRRRLSLIASNTQYVTLTGGEPTLLVERLFSVLDMCRQSLPWAQILLITNGRMFYYEDYARELARHGLPRTVVAVAIHSPVEEEHDRITRVAGSLKQTEHGIGHLLQYGLPVEVRVVVQQANFRHLCSLAEWVCGKFPAIAQVTFMGLELLGNAARNCAQVWVDYREAAPELGRAIQCVLRNGIVPRIYNFPLCVVEPPYWSFCAKSISEYKRTFRPECTMCKVRDYCGGLFGTPLNHRLAAVRPIERNDGEG